MGFNYRDRIGFNVNYTSSSLERIDNRVWRRVRTYHKGRCVRSQLRPLHGNKDWTGIPSGPGVTATVSVNRGKPNPRGAIDSYLRGADVPATVGDVRTVSIRPTAKRDWLVAMGFVKPNGAMTERTMEWVPGDAVYAEHDTETETLYDAFGNSCELPLRRPVECADDCTEDESLVILGGYFKAKEAL